MTPREEFAIRCISAYLDECPDDPEAVRFREAMNEARQAILDIQKGFPT